MRIKPDVAIQFENIKEVGMEMEEGEKNLVGTILRLTFVLLKRDSGLAPVLRKLKYELAPGEDFVEIVNNAHKNSDNSLAERFIEEVKSDNEMIRSYPIIKGQGHLQFDLNQ